MADAVEMKIKADAGQAKREMKALGAQFGKLGQIATSTEGKFIAAGVAVAAIGAAAVAAGKAFIDNAKAVAQNGDEFARMSRVLGTTNKEVQQLSFLATGARVDFKKLGSGLKRLQRNMLDATTGNKRMADTFEDLGVDVTRADGKLRNVMDVSRDLADEIKKMGKGANATGTLMLLLGRAGTETADVFLQGSEAFDKADESLRELGAYMSDEAIRASEAYTTASVNLGVAFQGVKNRLAEGLIPVLTSLIEYMTDTAIPATSNFIESVASLPDFFADLGNAALRAIPGLDGVADALDRISKREAAVRSERAKTQKTLAQRALGGGVPEDIDIGDTLAGMSTHLGGGGGSSSNGGGAVKKASKAAAPAVDRFADFAANMGSTFAEMQTVFFDPYLEAIAAQDAAEAEQDAKREALALKESARRDQWLAEAQVARDIQVQNAADVFGAVSSFAEMAQSAVEDSAMGQTKAGKAAALAAFVIAKAAALAQASVATALGIANALATPTLNPAVNAALAVGVGIAGAVQVGTIAATTIQGLADGGLAPGVLKQAGLNNHTVIGIRNDEAVIDPQGTSHITEMLGLQRRQMEMSLQGGNNSGPAIVNVSLDGRRLNEGLSPYQTAAIENGRDPAQNVRFGLARAS